MTNAYTSFLSKMHPESHFDVLLNCIPGLSFFLKNQKFELIRVNASLVKQMGLSSAYEVLGKTDFELFPKHLADQYRKDDVDVFTHAKPKLKIVEHFTTDFGLPDWFITHKFPVFSKMNKVIGVMGFLQSYDQGGKDLLPVSSIQKAIGHIREHYFEKIYIKDLARLESLSERQLNRKFVDTLGLSPKDFIIRTRIQAACRMMLNKPDLNLCHIAQENGFYDQTTFTRQFKAVMGLTPAKYLKKYQI